MHFCNLVQAVRAARFAIHELRPQRPWAPTDGAPPVLYFDAGDGEFWNAFRDAAAGYVIIVPCLEGEEADFVRNDPVLRERVPFDDEVPRNVLSSGRAKGCEYPAVIVYGFGEALEADIIGGIGDAPAEVDARRTLTLQYFVNRLYVAVSRAKRRLVIVDTERGVERLWKPAFNEYARERVLNSLGNKRDMWAEAVGGMSKGMSADLGTEAPPDRAAYARLFESDGKAKRDAYMLYQAATAYRDAGDSARARECRAWALEYEGRALEAGAAFAEAGLLSQARRVLWRSGRPGWLKLLEIAQQFPQLVTELETRWAKAIQQPPDLRAAADVIDAFDQRLRSDPAFARSVYGDPVWAHAVEQLLEPLLAERGKGMPAGIAVSFLETVERLEQHGVEVQRLLLADLYFAAEQFGRAADLWEQAGEKRSRRYLVAKARSAPYPECIDHFRLLDDQAAIVAAFDRHPSVALGGAQARAVAKALMGTGRHADALTCLGESATADLLLEIARGTIASAPVVAERALRRAVTAAAARGDWDLIGRLVAEPQTLIDVSSMDASAEQLLRRLVPELRLWLVRGLARSEALAETTAFAQRDAISQFLREFLRVKDGTWIGKVPLIEAGAAFERAGRFTDSLMYYEAVLRILGDQMSADELTAIRRRWLAAKARQLEVEESRVPVDAATVRRVRRELESAAAGWRMDPAERLPRYPILDPLHPEPSGPSEVAYGELRAAVANGVGSVSPQLPPAQLRAVPPPAAGIEPSALPAPTSLQPPAAKLQTAPSQRTELKAGELRFEVLREQRRCLITHLGSLETLKVEWSPPRVVGTVDVMQSGKDDEAYEVDAWKLSVRFAERRGQRVVMFQLKNEGAEVALET